MPKISIKDIEEGMVIARNVTSNNGSILLKSGIQLTDKHTKILKTWGITHVEIEGEESLSSFQDIISAHPEYLEKANDEAKRLFCNVDIGHPLFIELTEQWRQRYVTNMANQNED